MKATATKRVSQVRKETFPQSIIIEKTTLTERVSQVTAAIANPQQDFCALVQQEGRLQ